jgi:hypothetical protein
VTYFHSEPALTLRHPPSWTARLADQEGQRRYFESALSGAQRKTLTTTVVAAQLTGTLDQYAQSLLAGAAVPETRDETHGSAQGRRYRAASADGATRHSLLLLQEGAQAFGLHTQGQSGAFDERLSEVDAIEGSLSPEHVEAYPDHPNRDLAVALRVPDSWRSGRTLSGGGSYLTQYLSPPLAVDEGGHTVHASLTLTVEPAPGDGTVDAFRQASRKKLGDAFALIAFKPWRDGAQEILQTETSLTVSRSKRFYRTANGRAYGLAFEARDDVFPRVSRWCDLIASTLRVGTEAGS